MASDESPFLKKSSTPKVEPQGWCESSPKFSRIPLFIEKYNNAIVL